MNSLWGDSYIHDVVDGGTVTTARERGTRLGNHSRPKGSLSLYGLSPFFPAVWLSSTILY